MLNTLSCIQCIMVKRGIPKRCPSCTVEYKGHRSGEYNPALKSVYEHQGSSGNLVKVGYRCPICKKFFDLSEI